MGSVTWLWPDSTVVRVIDGDSIVAVVHRDLGFNGTASFQQRLRLNRINAPGIRTAEGQRSRSSLIEMVMGEEVLIETVGSYKYGDTWMAEITLRDGRNVSDALVAGGFALYWDGIGPRPGG